MSPRFVLLTNLYKSFRNAETCFGIITFAGVHASLPFRGISTHHSILSYHQVPRGTLREIEEAQLGPPYTEIFSKRRKIYAICVEGLRYSKAC